MKRLQILLVVLLYFIPRNEANSKTPLCDGHINVTVTAGTIACNGGVTTVTVTATGGIPPYTGTGTFTVSAGTYIYYVSGVCGSGSATITVNEPSFLNAFMSWAPIECYGGTAVTEVTAFGGTPPYSGTGNYTVTAGTPTVIVTDANGCTAAASMTFTDPAPFTATATAGTIACNGGTTTVTVTASGGVPPLSGEGTFTVSAGSYTYTVTDDHGCNATATITVDEPPLLEILCVPGEIHCSPMVSVNVTATGGTGLCTGTGVFTVAAGPSDFTITDANGCTATESIVTTAMIESELQVTVTAGTISCYGGTTTVTVTATGGNEPYEGTGTFTAAAGDHEYTVTCATGCVATGTITIAQPENLIAAANASPILCHGGSTEANVTATGGTAPYSGTGTFSVSAGVQNYTITDANGCSSSTSITVSEPDALLASATAGTIKCSGATTTVTVTATGGTAPYLGAETFEVIAGTYTYTVTDVHGCTSSTTITVADPPIFVVSAASPGIRCNGDITTITVSAVNGLAPYSGLGTYSVSAGTYYYTVTDANGCVGSTAITIGEPPVLTPSASGDNVACHGGSTTLTISATGGSTPYTGTGAFTVPAGPYNYTIIDNNGCEASITGTITEPAALVVDATPETIKCFGGSATVMIGGSGGISPYMGTGTFTAVAGDHTYTITDSKGCEASTTVTLQQPAQLSLVPSSTNAGCGGAQKGTATITAVGGTAPYTYQWIGRPADHTSTISNLGAGTYPVIVTDNNGCTANDQVVVNGGEIGQSGVTLRSTATNPLCHDSKDGAAQIEAIGGIPPYSFAWASGQTTSGISGLGAGLYSVKVTDDAGCFASTTIELTQPSDINITLKPDIKTNGFNIGSHGANDGSITSATTGGTAPYQYAWSNGSSTSDVNKLKAGRYELIVTDGNGCTASAYQVLSEPEVIVMSTGFTPNGDGQNDFFVIPGVEDYPNNSIEIFNRWGNKVWGTQAYHNNWTGLNQNNEQLPEGTYYVIFTVNGGEFVETGYVDLRR